MPITGFTWARSQGCDVHILRNNQPSRPLHDALIVMEEITAQTDPNGNPKVEHKTLKDILAGNVGAPPEFDSAIFIPFWSERGTRADPLISFNGITLNMATGDLKAEPQAGQLISSFFIEVILRAKAGHALNIPAGTPPPRIAVHVHNDITNAWVTPSSLTARPDVIKGIANLELKVISGKPIETIVWRSDDTFQQNMSAFLLNGSDPFTGNFQAGAVFSLFPTVLFENRRLFPINEVFVDPIHLEVKYAAQADPVRLTIPTHLSHLLKTGQNLDDGAGNDVFELVRVEKKAQYRASVYATFDDGTMGDITNHHGVTWERGPGVDVTEIAIDSDGAFEVFPTAVGKTLPIRALLPAGLSRSGLTEATGNIIVRDSWLNANPFAERLAGSPLQLAPAEIPNVLFVAEGFTDRDEFRKAALSLYNKLRTESKTTPWNHLFTNRMNAWMLFEESRETAASCLYENIALKNVRLEDGSFGDVALPLWELVDVGRVKLDVPQATRLNVFSLVLSVGLPRSTDAQSTLAGKTTEWQQLVHSNFGTGDHSFSADEFNFWKLLSERNLVEERDTAWGLRCGEKPKVAPVFRSNIISPNDESRLQRSNLNLFLSRVKDSASGNLIGEELWGRNRQGKFGKDYGLVIFLIGGLRNAGTRFNEPHFPQGQVSAGIGVGLVDDRVPLNFLGPQFQVNHPFFRWAPISGTPSFEMVSFPVPADVAVGTFATVAHEMCHSFNLEDEYTTPPGFPIPDGLRLGTVHNLQERAVMLDAGQLAKEKIKWRWPRIKKAGVFESAPTLGPTISVTLRAGDVGQFNVDEIVRFRQRNLLSPLQDLSSPDLKIVNKSEANRTLTLAPQVTTPVSWAAFGPTSILYLPVKAPSDSSDNPENDVYAEVLSPLMRHHIGDSPGPQTTEPCQPDLNDQQNPVNLPSNLTRPKNRRQIVGLFSGGRGFSCNVYHASGECIMRKETLQIITRVDGVERARDRHTYSFCHVCRYSLVDQIDPRQHDLIDREYDANYPLTEKGLSTFSKVLIVVGVIALVAGIGYLIYYLKTKDDE